jgi:hypothetical protein
MTVIYLDYNCFQRGFDDSKYALDHTKIFENWQNRFKKEATFLRKTPFT